MNGMTRMSLEWIDDVVPSCEAATLRRKTKASARQSGRCAADDGVDADEEADGDCSSKPFRRGPYTMQCKDGKGDATVEQL